MYKNVNYNVIEADTTAIDLNDVIFTKLVFMILKGREKEFKEERRVEGWDKKRLLATPLTVRNTKVRLLLMLMANVKSDRDQQSRKKGKILIPIFN